MTDKKADFDITSLVPWGIALALGYMLWTKDSSPGPAPDPKPITVDVRKASHDAAVAMVHRMADDIGKMWEQKPKTVLEAAAISVELDEKTRDEFKRSVAKFMEPGLGNDQIPTTADKLFSDMQAGYRSVK
jgi:hypothetical protein